MCSVVVSLDPVVRRLILVFGLHYSKEKMFQNNYSTVPVLNRGTCYKIILAIFIPCFNT